MRMKLLICRTWLPVCEDERWGHFSCPLLQVTMAHAPLYHTPCKATDSPVLDNERKWKHNIPPDSKMLPLSCKGTEVLTQPQKEGVSGKKETECNGKQTYQTVKTVTTSSYRIPSLLYLRTSTLIFSVYRGKSPTITGPIPFYVGH